MKYEADSGLDGYPMGATFHAPCAVIPAFVRANQLSAVAKYWDLPNADVYGFATSMGWKPSAIATRWYERPNGSDTDVQVMITGMSDCVYYVQGNS